MTIKKDPAYPIDQPGADTNAGAGSLNGLPLKKLLRKVFGVERLREGQQAVIDSVLGGRDTLVIMPTGGGKSLCFQLPAMVAKGTTIVVSPLISLMKDQVEKLAALGVPAVQVNSSLNAEEETGALDFIGRGQAKIIYCTPERLTNPEFLQVLEGLTISLVAIDEAHCISQWGHDFRPAYLELSAAIASLGRPPILALTATAPQDVVKDIRKQLGAPDMAVINTGIYRENLRYGVVQCTSQEERYSRALELIRQTDGVGIVYAATVKVVAEFHALLQEAGESVACYHGQLPARERKQNQELFMSGERRVMVATNAFGMGIDKGDTRFVIHLQMPSNLEAYYQESGRAGRDGDTADCTLLFLQDDKRLQQFFLARHSPTANDLKTVHDAAVELADGAAFPFDALQDKLDNVPEGALKTCTRLLKEARLLRQDRQLRYGPGKARPTAALFASLATRQQEKQEHDRQALERMVSYALSGYCRWKLLLDYFGADQTFERCCTCDNCVSPPAANIAPVEETTAPSVETTAPSCRQRVITVGARVSVPKFDTGTVLSVEGDKITIEFPNSEIRTFMEEFVRVEEATAPEPVSEAV